MNLQNWLQTISILATQKPMMSWPVSNKLRISLVMSFSGQSAITKGIKAELNQVSKTSLSFSRVSFSSSGNSCFRAFSSDSATIHLVKSNVNCIFFDTANYISYLASHYFFYEVWKWTENWVFGWVLSFTGFLFRFRWIQTNFKPKFRGIIPNTKIFVLSII